MAVTTVSVELKVMVVETVVERVLLVSDEIFVAVDTYVVVVEVLREKQNRP